jgi:ligand-binding sensor domain-containing protein/signal transduction histidine kinase
MFEHLTAAQGLSFNEVTAIMQDSRGFMWIGANGLYKYDGYSFTSYKTDPLDSTSISGPWISTLYEDRHGDLWVVANRQLNRFDRESGRITRQLSDRHPTSICEDTSAGVGQDRMWFTTFGKGTYRYDRGSKRFTEYRHNPDDSNTISSDSAFCALVDVAGTLWIGTANGLNSFDRARRQFTRYSQGPKGKVYTVYEDPAEQSGLLWIGANDGLYVYDRSKDSFVRYRNEFGDLDRPENNDVRRVYCDSKGRLWVGTMGGFARFDRFSRRYISYLGGQLPNTFAYVNKAWSICEDKTGTMWMFPLRGPLRKYDEATNEWIRVKLVSDHDVTFHAVCEDRSGTIWFGTNTDGILKLDRARKPFFLYTKIPGDSSSLSFATVTGICEDASGTIWVGTMGGLNKLNASTGTFTHYQHDDRDLHSLSNDRIWPIHEDRKGRLWIGTLRGGLEEFDRNTQRFVHHRYRPGDSLSLPNDDIKALCEDGAGRLWIGTDNANVSEYSPATNIFRRHFPGYPRTGGMGAEVEAILEDHTGLIWIAVPGGGLNSYNPASRTWTQYLRDPNAGNGGTGNGPIAPFSLCEDQQGTIWVGADVGLFRFDRQMGTCIPVTAKDDHSDNSIRAILEDGKGFLWLCTVTGLTKFDPTSGSFRYYDASDGVKIGPCNFPTGLKNRKGEMFLGGSNGLVRFHPDSIKDNPYVPPILITSFNKLDKPVVLDSAISEKHSIEMSYKENVFSFEFVALNYTSSERNQYAYKLEGFDADWVYCGTRRSATYTNLDGGSYTFRVKGSNNDGVWNEEGTSIAVIITPPFWRTWWFRMVGFVAILLSVGGSIRYVEIKRLNRRIEELEHERALERERTRISQDMHDEVGSSLSEIAILSELAKKKPEESGAHIQEISDLASEIIDNVSEIVWALNPRNDTLDNLVPHLRRYAVKYLNLAQIRCSFDAPDKVPPYHLTAELRRNLFLVVKEALHNIVKHAYAQEVSVMVKLVDNSMEILIGDNGGGFNVDASGESGNGLRNMEKRMTDIGGVLTLTSSPGLGSRVAIRVQVMSRQSP